MILEALLFFLPAGVANMTPIFMQKLFGPGRQIHPMFGSHKTWQGLISGTIAGGVFYFVMVYLERTVFLVSYIVANLNPAPVPPWYFGFLLGFGALAGDMAESFVKRRMNISPGKPWLPWDQIDYILGTFIVTAFVFWPGWQTWLIILIGYGVLHVATNKIGFRLGLKNDRF